MRDSRKFTVLCGFNSLGYLSGFSGYPWMTAAIGAIAIACALVAIISAIEETAPDRSGNE